MATPGEKLAQSLEVLHTLQQAGKVVFRSGDITRTHLERLLANGFLLKVLQGWYIASRPDENAGESTSWYTSFWKFSAAYLNERFGEQWCLAPEQSILLHTGNWTVPKQLMVRSPKGGNKPILLMHDTSLFDMRLSLPENDYIVVLDAMRVMSLPWALVNCAPGFFKSDAIDARAALLQASADIPVIVALLLEGGHSKVAGRIAGAFRNVGQGELADTIVESMRAAGYKVYEVDPFADDNPLANRNTGPFSAYEESPYANRLRLMWVDMRIDVLQHFSQAPLRKTTKAYLKSIDDIFINDAYNSLSIEGYQVSRELIAQIAQGDWNPNKNEQDRQLRDALAAKGYREAFLSVKNSIAKMLESPATNPVEIVRKDHSVWYRALFSASVTAGILAAKDLAGYRNSPVYIRHSKHVPPNYEAVRRNLMPTLFDLLANEESAAVRAVLGHFMFLYIHPYMDGNGRMGRFLMNTLLASGGYAWTVIPVEKRDQYMQALEAASVEKNIVPFTRLINSLMG